MKKGFVLLSLVAIVFAGCSTGKSVENKDLEHFKETFSQENYIECGKVYEKNTNEDFREAANQIIEEDLINKEKYINTDNCEEIEKSIKNIDVFYDSKKLDDIKEKLEDLKKKESKVEEKQPDEKVEEVKEEKPKEVKKTSRYGEFTYEAHTSSRFGFNISIPSFFKQKEVVEDESMALVAYGDSRERAGLFTIGINNFYGETTEDIYYSAISEFSNIEYNYLGEKSFALRAIDGEQTYYLYMVVDEFAANGFALIYPTREQEFFDVIVNKVYKSFKSGDLLSYH